MAPKQLAKQLDKLGQGTICVEVGSRQPASQPKKKIVLKADADKLCRQQPWCTYALHIATFTSLAFLFDPLLLASCWWATAGWKLENRQYAFWAQFVFMFAFTKVVKLVGLFRRHPRDVIFLPVSIVFGYFHGLIKLYALMTLHMVSVRFSWATGCFKG